MNDEWGGRLNMLDDCPERRVTSRDGVPLLPGMHGQFGPRAPLLRDGHNIIWANFIPFAVSPLHPKKPAILQ